MTKLNSTALSKTLSHALRHEPWIYELELDAQGWASLDAVLNALRAERSEWASLVVEDLEQMIATSSKKRHEIEGNRIRAFYGHSITGLLAKERASPPHVLYHGTAPEVACVIKVDGLKPMNRQYVHLSSDIETAHEVGRRKSKLPTILKVDAERASQSGVLFYLGNEKVWLADMIPSSFILEQ